MSTTIEKPKRVPKPVDPVKTAEDLFKKAINLYFYAAIGDLQEASNEDPKFPSEQYQNYENLRRASDEKVKRLKNICTIAPEIPQNLVMLFTTIKDEAASAKSGSYPEFVESTPPRSTIRLLSNPIIFGYAKAFEERLGTAPDQYSLMRANALDCISDGQCAMHAVTVIMNFMKVIAWRMACDIWYAKTPMNHTKFVSCCATLFIGQNAQTTIDSLLSEVRPKVKKVTAEAPGAVVLASKDVADPAPAVVEEVQQEEIDGTNIVTI
jgi:hypothetical protein